MFVGTDIYRAIKRVDKIDEIIHLTGKERFVEGLRAFIGIKPEQYIEELMEEKEVNNQLVKKGLEYLKQRSDIQRYIFPTGKSVDSCYTTKHEVACPVSKGAIGVANSNNKCYEEKEKCTTKLQVDLDNNVYIDSKKDGISWSRASPDDLASNEGELFCRPIGPIRYLSGSRDEYICYNAIGLSYSTNRTGDYTYITLGNGTDKVRGFKDSPNIFLVEDGDKEFYGANKDDIFILRGSEISGILDGGGGSNTLELGEFAVDEDFIDVKFVKQLNQEWLLSLPSSENTLKIKNMHTILGREAKQDKLESDCIAKHIDTRGGDYKSPDHITITSCNSTPKQRIVIRSNTRVDNLYRYNGGSYDYIILSGKGKAYINVKNDYIPTQREKHNFLFNYTISDLVSADVKDIRNVTFKYNNYNQVYTVRSITFSFKSDNGKFDVSVSDIPINANYQLLVDNTEIKVGSRGNLYAMQNNNKSIEEIVRDYPIMANRLKMSLFVQSSLSNETIAVGHGYHDVLHNNPYYKSHLIGNGGENIFVITSGHETLGDSKLDIPEVVIYDVDKENLIDTLDLRQIKQQVKRDWNKEVKAKVFISNKDLFIELLCFRENQVPKSVVKVELKDALVTNWYERLHVIIDNVPMRIEEFELKPLPLIFDESDKNIIVIGSQDVEEENRIVVSKEIGNYTFARLGNDLIITNASDRNLTGKELCTIFLSEFYQEPKMQTLSIIFTDQKISLRDEMNNINNAVTFVDQLNKFKNVSSIIDNYSNHIGYKNSESKHVNVTTNNHRQERSINLEGQEFFNAQNNAKFTIKNNQATSRVYENNNDQALFYGPNNANSSLKGQQVTSGGNKLSSWIGSIIGAATKGISQLGGLFSSIKASFPTINAEHPTLSSNSTRNNNATTITPHIDLDCTILLFDVFIRKITGQRYIAVNQDVSLLEVQASALNIIAEFAEILNSVCDEPAIDFAEAQSNIFKAMMSGSSNKIPGILCSYVEETKLEPEVTKKILSAFQPTKPTSSTSEGQTKHLPFLPKTAYKTGANPQTYLSNIEIDKMSICQRV